MAGSGRLVYALPRRDARWVNGVTSLYGFPISLGLGSFHVHLDLGIAQRLHVHIRQLGFPVLVECEGETLVGEREANAVCIFIVLALDVGHQGAIWGALAEVNDIVAVGTSQDGETIGCDRLRLGGQDEGLFVGS
jgi:hypothetical protein